ncbi:MHYT domain-containing protein [Streptomyces europaeiscabiei]|uniref:MHYT domain-containing protein n=1 Tax=Streptomyces europaeiscabiei TaxID=146819 RepID=A0AAJ2PR47_9ACTN|nr:MULTISPECIES: MHYT domain-containing protein [Streptomyces]KFG00670.1 membrane protein [Streptomyces scabiei]MDX2529582.1 MHYT domain-containing protein [Streptomyces europaeiscabiei]MDX2762213.1 MHYT domain-containing protein [Streptomyces europaeiscabiei]MDX2771960.1 MHYT domain-containing protein [Streptomyces europaeiscabiei]MDX3131768.1 MHYT domain-containing protein [Streptomyces europaeiscabiei]
MQGTVDGFSYGLVTPVVAYLMACLGGALGLRCTTRSMLVDGRWRIGWLALGSAAIGSGIWTMHFVAMMGFKVLHTPVQYDPLTTFASLAVAIVMVGIGIFMVASKGATGAALFTGGTITGLGIASMHYLGMAGLRLNGTLEYNTLTVAASVVIAVVAAIAALWAAGQVRGFLWSVGASLVMGIAVSGMHYTGMAALSVHLHSAAAPAPADGSSSAGLLAPLIIGPLVFLLLAGVVVMFDPFMIMGRFHGNPVERRPGIPAQATAHTCRHPESRTGQELRERSYRTPQNR